MSITRRTGEVLAWAAVAAGLDQATKWLMLEIVLNPPRVIEIAPILDLRLGFNEGVSFGIGRDWLAAWPNALAVFKLAVAAGLIVWAIRSLYRYERIGLALVAGGALGNAHDRWRQGAVTDFIDLHWGDWHWPTFNGADIAISLGVALLLFATFRDTRSGLTVGPASGPAATPRAGEQR